jgi:hypothetical protein
MYLSENHVVCLLEAGALLGTADNLVPHPASAWSIVNVQVTLQQIADLTLVREQNRIGMCAQELTGDWRAYQTRSVRSSVKEPTGIAPTQDLGQALYKLVGIEGFRTVSAKAPEQMNLVVFPQKLLKGSRLVYRDAKSGKVVDEVKG